MGSPPNMAMKMMMKKSMAKKTMKTSMKMMKSMGMKKKAMKVYKFAKAAVWKGKIVKTVGGLKKDSLVKSKSGKIVSKKLSLKGKKLYTKYGSKWMAAVSKARKALGIKGFVAIKKGSAFYKKAFSFYKK